MAKHMNPSLLGAFVLGGIGLLVAALFLFGGGALFKERARWVTYFQGSVGGLSDGAPVTFRGVPVGKVTKVEVEVNTKELTAQIPVYFEIDRSRIVWMGGQSAKVNPKTVIDAGLRTKLAMQSLVTGQMMVELDILPGSPARLVGADPKTPELPSVESEFDVLKQQLAKLPIEQILADTDRLVNNLNDIVQSPDTKRAVKELADTLEASHELVTSANGYAGPLFQQLTETAKNSREVMAQASDTLHSLRTEGSETLAGVRKLTGNTDKSLGDLRTTLHTADAALQQARGTLVSINGLVAEDTAGREDIEGTLANLNRASGALRGLADTLERNPNAVIVGK